ncbi:MAG: type II and III secretion system protein family protein [Gemmatimonadales bacterium]
MRKPLFHIAVLFCLAALFCWTQALAQEVPQRRPLATAPKPAAAVGPSTMVAGNKANRSIRVSLNKAEVITLSRPVRSIVMGNEAVANVHFDPEQPSKIFIVSQAIGSTNVFFMDERGEIIEHIEVTVVFDHDGIEGALKRLLPDEEIEVSVFRDSVFLTGKVHSASAAANAVNIARQFVAEDTNITNMMSVIGGQQVILLVRVAEMDRNVRKNLSADMSFSQNIGLVPGLDTLLFQTTSQAFTDPDFVDATLRTKTNVFGSPTFDVLERQNLVKTLAEPTLTAISGESASFLSGGEFPFPSGLDENGQTIFEFREFGIRLNFSPIVLQENRINLQISTEISSLGDVVNGQQSLIQKRTETTIELPSGGSLMISGLLKDDMTDTINGFPYLKDLPVLGALFRSSEFRQQQTELVVTVTAYLAKPADNQAGLALPTDGFEPASDVDIYLLGRLQHRYGKDAEASWFDTLMGPFGYIMK